MVDTLETIEEILSGRVQRDIYGHLVHPVIKLTFILLPLFSASVALLVHWFQMPLTTWLQTAFINRWLCLVFITTFTCQNLDFRQANRARTLRWLSFYIIAWILVLFDAVSIVSINVLFDLFIIRWTFGIIGRLITVQSALIVLLFFLAGRGFFHISASDAVWLSRFLFFKRLIKIHITVMVTYFVARKMLSQQIANAWAIAWYKARLVRKSKGWLVSRWTGLRLLIQNWMLSFRELAHLTVAILLERGFFEGDARNPLPIKMSNEDLVALVMCLPLLIFLILGK